MFFHGSSKTRGDLQHTYQEDSTAQQFKSIKSQSNDCSTTVIIQMCNSSILYATQPKNIVKIIVCIIIMTICQHTGSFL